MKNRRNRGTVIAGVALILFGLFFLIGQFAPQYFGDQYWWPWSIVGVGVIFLVMTLLSGAGGLAMPATILTGTGLMLYWQNLTGHWYSWAYTWTLMIGLVGLGLILGALADERMRRALPAGLILSIISLAAFVLYGWLYAQGLWQWPYVIIGVGAIFMLMAVLLRIAPLMIPGVIIAGTGLLLYWQNLTGNWQSWSYAWAVIPVLVGLGILLAGVLSPAMRTAARGGWITLLAGLAALLVFWSAFTGGWRILSMVWPLLLVVIGALILLNGLKRRRSD
ncbi:MAG TPA: hypothetical protein VKF38_08420 [Anaerolineaceae bacterium]|nr:hypothetical protein [Anaerolineaceae bacterium]